MGEIADLSKVYQWLCDEESRETYSDRLEYLASGSFRPIERTVRRYLGGTESLVGQMEAFLRSVPADRPIVFYGAGDCASRWFWLWKARFGGRLTGFCDRDAGKQRDGYLGLPVMPPEKLSSHTDKNLVIATWKYNEEVRRTVTEMGFPKEQVYVLPCGQTVYQEGQYFDTDIIKLGEDELFLDVGCYDMATSVSFRKRCGSIRKIYAFEPSPRHFSRCMEKKASLGFGDEMVLLPFGAWSADTKLAFSEGAGGDSCIDENGLGEIEARKIDGIISPDEKVTFIKMDVEGAELEALKGARETILRDRPRLAVCIYHKPEDMTEIPIFIKSLVPEYRLYVRHHSNDVGETVLYAVLPEQLPGSGRLREA